MEIDHKIPDILKDPDFRESFLEDISTASTQLTEALKHDNPAKTAGQSSMREAMKAMHMLRGAAGVIDFKLGFQFAEVIHRIAEVGLSFADNLRSDFLTIYGFIEESDQLLKQVVLGLINESLEPAADSFQQLQIRIFEQYGDYFYDTNADDDSDADIEEPAEQPKEAQADDFEDFLAAVEETRSIESPIESNRENQDSEDTHQSGYDLSADQPADWDVLQYFYQEIDENLIALENAWLALERGEFIEASMDEVFRLTHSTKGAANSMGMYRIAKMMHALEHTFEQVRSQKIALLPNDFSIILATTDLTQKILSEVKSAELQEGLSKEVFNHFNAIEHIGSSEPDCTATTAPPAPSSDRTVAKVSSDQNELTNTTVSASTFRIESAKVDTLMDTVGELIISRTRMSQQVNDLLALCNELTKSRIRMSDTVKAFNERFAYTNAHGEPHQPRPNASPQAATESEFSSMEFDRYDDFNILSRQVAEIGNDTDLAIQQILARGSALQFESNSLSNYVSRIQDEIASTRLAPIATLFKRLERSVRDAAHKADRKVRFQSIGDDLLIDKSILDDLFAPMLHLVRNSVAHGFTEDNEGNLITIEAKQAAGRILLRVSDNGQGINYQRIRQTADNQGLLSSKDTSDAELLELIFTSGFSTSDTVDEVAGRGIGLNAVRESIHTMNGSIDVTSNEDTGTTFTLHLPLTLAIDRAMYFNVGDNMYAVFMGSVEQVYFAHDLQFKQIGEKEVAIIDDESIPLIDLPFLFGAPQIDNSRTTAIIRCRHLNSSIAFRVDQVTYQDDIVVKSLGALFDTHRYFGSATIYGDGQIVPILDIGRISKHLNGNRSQIRTVQEKEPEGQAPTKVLIVDDSLSVRKVCENYLLESGYYADTANDGIEAINRVKAEQYDLIITDLEMPRLNGLELIAELKRRDATATIPILVITSRTTEKHRSKALSLGAAQCIGKPFTRENIIEQVENYA